MATERELKFKLQFVALSVDSLDLESRSLSSNRSMAKVCSASGTQIWLAKRYSWLAWSRHSKRCKKSVKLWERPTLCLLFGFLVGWEIETLSIEETQSDC